MQVLYHLWLTSPKGETGLYLYQFCRHSRVGRKPHFNPYNVKICALIWSSIMKYNTADVYVRGIIKIFSLRLLSFWNWLIEWTFYIKKNCTISVLDWTYVTFTLKSRSKHLKVTFRLIICNISFFQINKNLK